ncbi:MAG: YgaP-like transmembrane domain [Quisquiliibacterium sp.]
MSLERAILLIVGVVVLGSVLLGVYHNPGWFWVTGVMGAHLIQASFTGMCPVVRTLKALGLAQRPGFS